MEKINIIHKVENLELSREFLKNYNISTNTTLTVTNSNGTKYYYGVRVLDCIFRKLIKEFYHKIDKIFIDGGDNFMSQNTAQKFDHNKILDKKKHKK